MSLPSPVSKANVDQGTDDPRVARVDIATLFDAVNAILTHLGLSTLTSSPLTVGEGLEASAGTLRAKLNGSTLLRSASGLSVNVGSGANQVLALDASSRLTVGTILALLDAQQQVRWSGTITPATLATNTDDWNPTDLATAAVIRVSASAAIDLTGIQGGAAGRILVLENVGAFPITLRNDQTSTAANRFLFPADTTLAAEASLALIYDGVASRWRSTNAQAGSGSAAEPKYATTAVDLALDDTYHLATVEASAACTVTLPDLPDDSDHRGFRVTIRNVATAEADVTISPAGGSGNLIEGQTSKKLWLGTECTLVWKGGDAWEAYRTGWMPADRVVAAGGESTISISLLMVPANAREVMILWNGVQPVGGTSDLGMRYSIDGGATYDSGTNYVFHGSIYNTAGGSAVHVSAGLAQIALSFNLITNVAVTGASKGSGRMTLQRPRSGEKAEGQVAFSYPTSATTQEGGTMPGVHHKTAHSIDGIRLFWVTAARTFAAGAVLEAFWR